MILNIQLHCVISLASPVWIFSTFPTGLGKTRISAIHIAPQVCGVKGRIYVAERTRYVCGFINCQWKKIAQGCMFKKSPFVGRLQGRITSWLSKIT